MNKLTINFITFAFFAFLVTGCVAVKPLTRVPGKAVVRVSNPLLLVKVDGKPGNAMIYLGKHTFRHFKVYFYTTDALVSTVTYDLDLEPGRHDLEFLDINTSDGHPVAKTLNVEAGCLYQAAILKDSPTSTGVPFINAGFKYNWTVIVNKVE